MSDMVAVNPSSFLTVGWMIVLCRIYKLTEVLAKDHTIALYDLRGHSLVQIVQD
jgi:hypothetical protein